MKIKYKSGLLSILHQLGKSVTINKASKRIQHERSDMWLEVRHNHLQYEPVCQYCGSHEHLEVHHIKPFHLFPSLELDPSNLITLCDGVNDCHLRVGHNGDWKEFNLWVVSDCAKMHNMLR